MLLLFLLGTLSVHTAYTPEFPPEDLNQDGIVNYIDLLLCSLAQGSYDGVPHWNPPCDLNGDGFVDVDDYDGFYALGVPQDNGMYPPIPSFSYSPSVPIVGQEVDFDASSSDDSDGYITEYYWDFFFLTWTAYGEIMTYAHDEAGEFFVVLTVTDNEGMRAARMGTLLIVPGEPPAPPVASFTYSPEEPLVNELITFNASSSTGDIVSYDWNFGDGTFGTGGIITHAYSEEGTYIVSLTVIDEDANADSVSKVIIVKPLGGQVEIFGPSATVVFATSASPLIRLYAAGYPSGGGYRWEIAHGKDKVRFVGSANGKSVIVQGIAPSEEKDDIRIGVTYTARFGTCQAFHSMTVQKPTFLKVADGYPQNDNSTNIFGRVTDYTTTYLFEIYDQLDPANKIKAQMMVEESLLVICANQEMPRQDYQLRELARNGLFFDDLQPTRTEWTPFFGLPDDYFAKIRQTIWVAGWLMPVRCQIQYSDHAVSVQGTCGSCD